MPAYTKQGKNTIVKAAGPLLLKGKSKSKLPYFTATAPSIDSLLKC